MRGKKFGAWLLTAALLLGMLPMPAMAAGPDDDTGYCPHHTEHTPECGYIAPTGAAPCQHEHTAECWQEETVCVHTHREDCYSDGVLPMDGEEKDADACAHVCTEDSGCVTLVPDCQHEHDGACGYAPADPGQPCGYVCRICPVQALLDALPDAEDITASDRASVEEQLAAIDEARMELTDEETDQLDTTRYQAIIFALSALDGQAGADVPMLAVTEQFTTLTPGETYWFDLSGAGIPGTVNTGNSFTEVTIPDTTLHWVPFTYAGTINAYTLTSAQETTEEYANRNKYDHSLFIADYTVTHSVDWNNLNDQGMIFGTSYTSGGISYTMRTPSAGSSSYGETGGAPQSNEWDSILNKEERYIKNWNEVFCWGQDQSLGESGANRVIRGWYSARFWYGFNATERPRNVGFRPVLELPVPDNLSSGLKVVTLDLDGGKAGTTDTKQDGPISIVVKSGETFTAPSGEGLTAPSGKTFGGWKDSSVTIYSAGDSVPSTVNGLTAYWVIAPSITAHPQNQSVPLGQTATFTVTASGEPAPTYQWQVNEGSSWENISGATGSSYTTAATTIDMNGWKYRCVATNSVVSSATSSEATLTVLKLDPTLTNPTAKTDLTYTGSAQTLVNAGDTTGGELRYSLEQNGSYSTTIPTGTDAGDYDVYYKVVGNDFYNDVPAAGPVSVTINKAANSISEFTCANIVYGGTPAPSATASFGTPAFTYSDSENGTYGAWNTQNPKGTWYVKASVEGTNNYEGAESDAISFSVTAEREPTPTASINYTNETLTSLTAGASYSITPAGGQPVTIKADGSGNIVIQADWFGKTLSIVKPARDDNHSDSEAQSLSIPQRPAAPATPLTLTKTANSITVTNTYSGCEFSADGTSWNDTGAFTGLTAGTEYPVQVRVKATANSFKSASMTQAVTTTAADGTTTVKPGESVTTDGGTTVTNDGEKTTVTDGGTTTTITPPAGGDVGTNADGGVTVPGSSTVQTGSGPEITVGPGNGGTVGDDGTVTVPGGGSVQVGDTTITLPSGGGTVTPAPGGNVTVPGGSTVQTGSGPEITVGPGNGGTVGGDGGVTVPGGGSVQVGDTTITLPSGGGTVTPAPDGNVTVPGGSTVTKGDGTTTEVPSGGGSVDPDTGEVTLNTHTVTFDSQGGSAVPQATVTHGGKLSAPAKPTRSGYDFGGWYKESACTTAWNFDTDVVTGNITLYAKWTETLPDTYTVAFNSQGGSAVSSQTVAAGGKVTKPSDPTRSGYTFGGWYKESTCTTAWNFDTDTVTGDITLYARWTARPTGGGNGGGIYTPPTYPPTVERPSVGGTVTVSPSRPSVGDKVTIRPKPDNGYEVDKITVTDRNGKPVTVTKNPDGSYSFTQPSGTVKVEVSYKTTETKPADIPWINPYWDVSEAAWYYSAVRYVSVNGLMGGYGDGRFGPNDYLSRAQLAQILHNREGKPGVNYLLQFNDVANGTWYTEAIRWATSRGIVGGYGDGHFGPNDNITREQLAVMLWRYAGSPAATDRELHFADAYRASDWALEALRWATEHGIINGKGNGILDPGGQATRAEAAQMLMNFLQK